MFRSSMMKNYMLVLAIVFAALSFTHGAPQMRRHKRHRHWSSMMADDQNHANQLAWNNPCGTNFAIGGTNPMINNTQRPLAMKKPLKPLRAAIPNLLIRLNTPVMRAIDTSDVSQWFSEPFNSTYGFLHQLDGSSSNIFLRKRHIETQVYVGAIQYLFTKQLKHDRLKNEGYTKSIELDEMRTIAKNLLCEIESAIYRTRKMQMPKILSKDEMNQRLTFRNNNRDRKSYDQVDDIDSKFVKVRFNEYLFGLQQVLKNHKEKQHLRNMNKSRRPTEATAEVSTTAQGTKNDDGGILTHKKPKKNHPKNGQKNKHNQPKRRQGKRKNKQRPDNAIDAHSNVKELLRRNNSIENSTASSTAMPAAT